MEKIRGEGEKKGSVDTDRENHMGCPGRASSHEIGIVAAREESRPVRVARFQRYPPSHFELRTRELVESRAIVNKNQLEIWAEHVCPAASTRSLSFSSAILVAPLFIGAAIIICGAFDFSRTSA